MAAYRRHQHELIRFATVLVGTDDAQDVVSKAMMGILDGRPDLDNPRAYLFQAIANQARNHRRGEARRRKRQASAVSPEAAPPSDEPHPEVWSAVKSLSARQKAVVYLTYWEDLSDSMVADRLGIGAGSVRRHLARARKHIRRALDEH